METKKIQEIWVRPGTVERFVEKPLAAKIRQTFARIYSLDMDEDGDKALHNALANPEDYVLKSQRECGENVFYKDGLEKLLKEVGGDSRRSSYILMEKIRPKPSRNYIVSYGRSVMEETVCELGVFGAVLVKGNEFLENCTAGHVLRSKSMKYLSRLSRDFMVFDSPLLTDE